MRLNFTSWLQILSADPWWQWALLFSGSLILGLLLWRLAVWWGCLQASLKVRKKTQPRFNTLKSAWRVKRTQGLGSQAKSVSELPLFLRTLGSTLKAGYSVPQALEFTIEEIKGPLKQRLEPGLQLLKIKQPLNLVLREWQPALPVPEFRFLLDSLALQARQGGNLVQLCYTMATLLEERQKLERDVKSFTAQGKMSGVLMALLWPLSLMLFAWLSPSHIEVLFNTSLGKTLLLLSLGLELIGFALIWRLVRVTF